MAMTYNNKKKIFFIAVALISLIVLVASCALLITSIYGEAIFSSKTIQAEKAEKYAAQAKDTPKGGVVFVGDSIMELYKLDKYFKNKNYINRGISSNESAQVLARLKTNVIDIKPNIVFIHVGTNDIGHGVSEATYLKNMEAIIKQLKEQLPQTKIIVNSIFPTVELNNIQSKTLMKTRPNSTITSCNARLKNLCSSNDVMFLNTHKLLLLDDELNRKYTLDGLHLNSRGYRIISKEIAKYL